MTGDKFIDWCITSYFSLTPDMWLSELLIKILYTGMVLMFILGICFCDKTSEDGCSAI